jgi:hypothetical protein
MQRSIQKEAVKNFIFFDNYKMHFFPFFSFQPLLFHQCIMFSFFVQIEGFKLLWNHHLKSYKSSSNFKGNKIIFKDFFEGIINRLWIVWSKKQIIKTNLPTWGSRNFFIFNSILAIISVIDAPWGEFHLLFGHHKQWGLPAKMASKPYLP